MGAHPRPALQGSDTLPESREIRPRVGRRYKGGAYHGHNSLETLQGINMRFTSFFSVLAPLVVTGFSAHNAKCTVAQVEADIATITSQVNALNNAINGFPATAGTLSQALVGQA